MKKELFYYDLPKELIAQKPIEKRDASRLMVLDRKTREISHRHFYDIIEYLKPGDVLVRNNTKVIPARLFGVKEKTGALIEVFLLRPLENDRWEALVRPGKRLKEGDRVSFGEGKLVAEVLERTDEGGRIIEFTYSGDFKEILEILGEVPLPPYIKEKLEDKDRYQTVYAKTEGSVAAPTAGLHFTKELIEALKKKGITIVDVTLHVGLGTFRPLKEENIADHKMHSEYYEITEEAAKTINQAKQEGRRIIAIGTTATRTLESNVSEEGLLKAGKGFTDIFIYPGYTFRMIDALITNFHLPESTLIMLVSALADREWILEAYRIAVEEKYRFFSFGDAMLIL